MPKMDGHTTLTHLKENEVARDVPVLVLTNVGDMDDISKVFTSGVYDYMVKADSSLEQIVAKVRSMLERTT